MTDPIAMTGDWRVWLAVQLGSCRLYLTLLMEEDKPDWALTTERRNLYQILLLEGYRSGWVFLIEKHSLYPNHLLGSWHSGWELWSGPETRKEAFDSACLHSNGPGLASSPAEHGSAFSSCAGSSSQRSWLL